MGIWNVEWVNTVMPFVGDGKSQVVIAQFLFCIVGNIHDISTWLGLVIQLSGDTDGFYLDGVCAKTALA